MMGSLEATPSAKLGLPVHRTPHLPPPLPLPHQSYPHHFAPLLPPSLHLRPWLLCRLHRSSIQLRIQNVLHFSCAGLSTHNISGDAIDSISLGLVQCIYMLSLCYRESGKKGNFESTTLFLTMAYVLGSQVSEAFHFCIANAYSN